MTLEQRIADLKAQLATWQERRQQATAALQEAQSAVLQLTGALAFAESLLVPEGDALPIGMPAENGGS